MEAIFIDLFVKSELFLDPTATMFNLVLYSVFSYAGGLDSRNRLDLLSNSNVKCQCIDVSIGNLPIFGLPT